MCTLKNAVSAKTCFCTTDTDFGFPVPKPGFSGFGHTLDCTCFLCSISNSY